MSQDPKERRIFVVDDETVVATALGKILRLEGFQVHVFDKPFEALRVAIASPPDMLITDVVMPLLSGIELAILIRKLCPNCKVPLCSGQATTANLLERARASGHDFEILLKPIRPEDLIKRLHAAFND